MVGLTSLLYVVAPESSPRLPLAILVQLALPVLAGSIGMGIATATLNRREEGSAHPLREALSELRFKASSLVGAAMFAAAIAAVVMLLAFGLWPIVIALSPAFFGPPLIVQAVSLEAPASLTVHIRGLRAAWRGRLAQLILPLLNVVIATTLIAMVLLGGFAVATLEAPDALRGVVGSLLQIVVPAVLVGFLAAVEYEAYRDLTAPVDATQD